MSATVGSTSRFQARLLDLGAPFMTSVLAIIVTHDLAYSPGFVALDDGDEQRLVIEQGLTDRVLMIPREPYTQLLRSSFCRSEHSVQKWNQFLNATCSKRK